MIAHVSSPQTAEAIAVARRAGADVWVETCHHYLCTSKEVAGSDLRQKWNPPTRDRAAVDALWRLLEEGHVHTVASDHAPLPKGDATNIWDQAPGSGNGVEIFFPLFATQAVHERGIPLTRVAELVATTPARLFGLAPRKGAIALGADADFAIVETNGARTLDARELEYHDQEKLVAVRRRDAARLPGLHDPARQRHLRRGRGHRQSRRRPPPARRRRRRTERPAPPPRRAALSAPPPTATCGSGSGRAGSRSRPGRAVRGR